MEYATVVKGPMVVTGISTKVSLEEEHANKQMDQLWDRFFSENIYDKIPSKANANIVVVYFGYEGENKSTYQYLLGCEVTSSSPVPAGMIAKEIPASTYAQFSVKGKFPEVLKETWDSISKSVLKRLYSGDIEIYSTDHGRLNYNNVVILVSIE